MVTSAHGPEYVTGMMNPGLWRVSTGVSGGVGGKSNEGKGECETPDEKRGTSGELWALPVHTSVEAGSSPVRLARRGGGTLDITVMNVIYSSLGLQKGLSGSLMRTVINKYPRP